MATPEHHPRVAKQIERGCQIALGYPSHSAQQFIIKLSADHRADPRYFSRRPEAVEAGQQRRMQARGHLHGWLHLALQRVTTATETGFQYSFGQFLDE